MSVNRFCTTLSYSLGPTAQNVVWQSHAMFLAANMLGARVKERMPFLLENWLCCTQSMHSYGCRRHSVLLACALIVI